MSIFLILVIFGGVGFSASAMFGMLAGGHHGGAHHHGAAHHGAAHHGAAHHGALHHGANGHHTVGHHGSSHTPAHHAHDAGGDANNKPVPSQSGTMMPWWTLISPLDIFAYAIGAGFAGLALQTLLHGPAFTICLVLGALVFNWVIVKPLMGLLMRFAAPPSQNLDNMVSQPCEAASKFDSQGKGLVKLSIDGQIVQLLGILDSSELDSGSAVNVGDRLLVVDIDTKKNQCRVIKTADAFEAAIVKNLS